MTITAETLRRVVENAYREAYHQGHKADLYALNASWKSSDAKAAVDAFLSRNSITPGPDDEADLDDVPTGRTKEDAINEG